MKKRKWLPPVLIILVLALVAGAVMLIVNGSRPANDQPLIFKSDLNKPGMRIGVATGSASSQIAARELPDATLVYSDHLADGCSQVRQGKLDAYVFDRRQMELAIKNGITGVHLLDDNLIETIQIAVGLSPHPAVPDLKSKMNAFIAEMKQNGTLDDMYHRWVELNQETMPSIPLPENPQFILRIGTSGIVPPYSYYRGTELSGYDIELGYRFASWLGADVQFSVYDYSGLITAAAAGEVDCVMADLNITPERAESMEFSEPLFVETVGIMVQGEPAVELPASISQLEGYRFGVPTGTNCGEETAARFPAADIQYFENQTDLLLALRSGNIDAVVMDAATIRFLQHENDDLVMMNDRFSEIAMAPVFPKTEGGKALCDQYSGFVRNMKAIGMLDEISDIWFGKDENLRTIPDYTLLPDINGTLTMAVDATLPPFAYVKGTMVVGYDVDVAYRFCKENGYRLKVVNTSFASILPGVQSGIYDFSSNGITITPEREESLYFSEPIFSSGNTAAVLRPSDSAATKKEFSSLSELENSVIGVQTGTAFDIMMKQRFPDASLQPFSSYTDLIAALTSGKIDAFPADEPVIRYVMGERSDIDYIHEFIDDFDFAFCFAPGEAGNALRNEFNEFILGMKSDGRLSALSDKWFGADENTKDIIDYRSLPAPNGTLTLATDGDNVPFEYMRNGITVGYEIEIAALFCEAKGYGLKVKLMNFDSILPEILSGKSDFGASTITITPERSESVRFSEPTYSGGVVMAVAVVSDEVEPPSFFRDIKTSFNKTFIREDRWKLFIQGVLNTLLITALSAIFGTILGFGIFMLCRNGSRVANACTHALFWLVQGTPMVVLLMILYYIIFGSLAISNILVAVIGFSLTFGAAVFGLLKIGVGAVDPGQYEAAYALGHTNSHTFFRIILPQALPHVLPAYKGEMVSLIKATAVVGYIAVQDLTKMGDIVRSRTYEAFFPLIAVTVIYFVLESMIAFLVSRIEISTNPKRRRRSAILKGVKTDD